MMAWSEVVLALAWVFNAAVLLAVVFWVIPTIARIRFLTRVEKLRDRAVDSIFDGKLRRHPAVLEFIEIQETLGLASRDITISRAIAFDLAFQEMGVEFPPPASRSGLRPTEGRILDELETSSKRALYNYLVWGSPAGYLGRGLFTPLRMLERSRRRRHAAHTRVRDTDVLVQETFATARSGPSALQWPGRSQPVLVGAK